MNIHGYKKKAKIMTGLLKRELDKPPKRKSEGKINRLKKAKANCLKKIKELKQLKNNEKDNRTNIL